MAFSSVAELVSTPVACWVSESIANLDGPASESVHGLRSPSCLLMASSIKRETWLREETFDDALSRPTPRYGKVAGPLVRVVGWKWGMGEKEANGTQSEPV